MKMKMKRSLHSTEVDFSFLNTVAKISILNIIVGAITYLIVEFALSNPRNALEEYLHDIGGGDRTMYTIAVKILVGILTYIIACYVIKIPACYLMKLFAKTPFTFFLPVVMCSGFPNW
jgi:hypothetical protein